MREEHAGRADRDGKRRRARRASNGREVDIVGEDESSSVVGIEVKLSATPHASDFAGLRHMRDNLGARFSAGALIHTGAETLPFGDRLWAVPIAAVWA